jgi:phytoene desaturase
MPKKKVIIVGSGISSLSAGSFLAKEGFDVTILEKNDSVGGRARFFEAQGFRWDMGPSWYWMPDVFERFYNQFGKTTADFYELKRLDPSYRIYWQDGLSDDIPAKMSELNAWFESLEPGSSIKLAKFLKEAKYKYEVGMQDLVHKPSLKISEFADMRILKGLFSMHILKSFSKHVRSYFSHPKLLEFLEFQVLFLGATPQKTPALYSLMNYADIVLGTWYPMGGMYKIIEAFEKVALDQGVKIITNTEVLSFETSNKRITSVQTNQMPYEADIVISGADYHHTDLKLLGENANYSEKYWDKRTLAPSCLIFYVGINRRVKNLKHHNLFFDTDFSVHADEIYENPAWPSSPLFYMCISSLTDPTVAPEGHENLFFLIPIAPDLKDSESIREEYFELLLDRLEKRTGENIKNDIVYKRSYCLDDFKMDYNSFKGNAYGLANTLRQTAILKPRLKSKKLTNMYYSGQLTVPGPGIPPTIISGEVVAKQIIKDLK